MARVDGAGPRVRWAVPVVLCAVAMLLAFVPLMRLAAGEGRQGVLFALVVCGSYGAGAALLADEARRGHGLWRVRSLVVVAGVGMALALTHFLAASPVTLRVTTAVLVPGLPALALEQWLRTSRPHRRRK